MFEVIRRSRRDDGVEAVEFALVVPILLLLISGIVNLGFAYNAATLVSTAVRDGARMASLGGSVADMCNSVWGDTATLPNIGAAQLTIVYDTVTVGPVAKGASACSSTAIPDSGETATVTLTYTNKWLIPVFFNNETTITRSSQMRVE